MTALICFWRAGFVSVSVLPLAVLSECVWSSSSLNPLSERPTFTAMAKRSGKAKAGNPKLCLVRWLEDETVSVVPATTAEAKQKVYVGAIVNFKWLKQMYEAEVLKISSKS